MSELRLAPAEAGVHIVPADEPTDEPAEPATNEHDVAIAEAQAEAAVQIAEHEATADIAEAAAAVEVASQSSEERAWHEEHRNRLSSLEAGHQEMLARLEAIQSSLTPPTLTEPLEEPTEEPQAVETEPTEGESQSESGEAESPAPTTERKRRRWI